MRFAAVPLVMVLALSACGGDHGNEPSQTTTTAPPITREALAAMVPRTAEFPPEARSLANGSAAVDRGYVTNAQASAETPDPTDSGADLARLGRTGGYRNTVAPYTFVTTLALAEASVHAFRSDEEAQRFLDAEFLDLHVQAGKEDPNFGGKVASLGPTFVPPALFPAVGVQYTVVAGSDTLHVAVEGFRMGRVVGSSTIARLDPVDPRPLADELAQTLRLRMDRAGA